MRNDSAKKRVFMVCGHAQSGKTSLVEAILYACGAITRLGTIEDGTTTGDWEEDEKARKSSINLSVLGCEYKGQYMQIIDTPGYLDFVGDVITSASAVDFAVIVVDATAGVEVGTEKAWEILCQNNKPCLFFINKLDKENTSFSAMLEDIRASLSKAAVPLTLYENGRVVDVIKEKKQPYYSQIMDAVAETDDALLSAYLDTGDIADDTLVAALKKAIITGKVFPVTSGVAVQSIGINEFLEGLLDMPSVSESAGRKARKDGAEMRIQPHTADSFVAHVFKTIIDPFVGQMSILRVYSGSLAANTEVYNVTKGSKEKINQLFFLQGKQQSPQDGVCAGDIAALPKLKDVSTGDVLCGVQANIEFDQAEFPAAVFSASVKPKTRHDEEKISAALQRLMAEDPTFKVHREAQTHELVISGMGELHLRIIIERMKRKYGADVELGTPKIAYKETVTHGLRGDKAVRVKYKKQTGGHGQYGDCMIELEPLERGKGFEFVDKIVGGAIPRNFIPSVEKGVVKAMEEGILAGYPVVDVRVNLVDGSYHDVDSSDIAFQIAGSMAFRQALEQAGVSLLEPIMDVGITIPGEFTGAVTGSINAHRGRVLGMEAGGKNEIIKAHIPLAEMFKYAGDLRSITGGRGSYAMELAHYEILNGRLAQTVIDSAKKEKEQQHQHA